MKEYLENLFEKPRWPDGPHICHATNLPAFETVEQAKAITRTCDGDALKETWTCSVCGLLHADYRIRPPAGNTSGSGRVPWPSQAIARAKKLAVQPRIERP